MSSPGAHSMDDINRLLYLDALQRSIENQNFIAHKVEEAFRDYQKRYHDYANLYSKYVELMKKATTRKVLQHNRQTELDFATAEEDIKCINGKLNDEMVTSYVDTIDLETLKTELVKGHKSENLKRLRTEMMELKKCTESIQNSMDAIEAGLDTGIYKTLDVCAEELHMSNFPKLGKKT